MQVMTAPAGFAASVSFRISPRPCMPISTTAYSTLLSRRNSVFGMPISLFWLPSVLSVLPKAENTA